jgi:RsiW-degrading membrane proteinase PrsW (M82 family)
MSAVRSIRRSHRPAFVRVHEPAFWVFVILLVTGGVTTVGTLAELSSVSRSGWVLAWVLLTLYAIPIAVIVYRLDLYEREPIPLAVAAFVWGALGATGLAIEAAGWNDVLASLWGTAGLDTWGHAVLTPLLEETVKGAGLVLLALFARDEFDDMMDGFVYGALAGLGFAVVEDVVYFMAVFGGTPAGVLEGFSTRVLASGLYGHVLYTALVGMAIGVVAADGPDAGPLGRRSWIAAGLTGAAIVGHIAWNLPTLTPDHGVWTPLVLVIKGVPLLVFVVLAVRVAHRRERRWLDRALADPAVAEVVTPGDAVLLRDAGARRRHAAAVRRRSGSRAAAVVRRLQREQVNLAMIVNEVPGDATAIASQRELCRSLRLAVEAIPGGREAEG